MRVFFGGIMNIKIMAVVIASYFACTLGSTFGTIGVAISVWYFFVFDNVNRFYWEEQDFC